METRTAVAAGRFYPSSKAALIAAIEDCFLSEQGPGKLPLKTPVGQGEAIIGLVCPHAGYIYSGATAAHGFLKREGRVPNTVIIVGPNHSGRGAPVSIYPQGQWRTPLGDVQVNQHLAEKIVDCSQRGLADYAAHAVEHSIEVQLPFLQYLYGNDFDIVPVCLRDQAWETSRELGAAIYAAIDESMPLIIASSDFTHYESAAIAEEKDHKALERIGQMDPQGLMSVVNSLQISMCGHGAIATMLVAAKKLEAAKADVLTYQTSGSITGDLDSVVGYAAVAVAL